MTQARALRALLEAPRITVAPGAYDALTARLVAGAGFPVVYMTGAGVSASRGYPDYGLLTLTEMVDAARTISRAVDIPVIADADTGYGNELNVTLTVREYEASGVAGLHIEDQVAPKRCGHLAGKELVSLTEFTSKIRAAAEARKDPDFLIIARTDARAVSGLDDAIDRANAALAAGADMAFVEALESREELALAPQRVNGPCLLNVVPGGRTPILTMEEAEQMGYALAIHPGAILFPMVSAIDQALSELRLDGASRTAPGDGPAGLFKRMGSAGWDAIRQAAADRAL